MSSHQDRQQHEIWYGKIELLAESSAIEAGSYCTLRYVYTVGRYGLDIGGRIRLLTRLVSDMEVPQWTDPQADNYMTVTTSNPLAKADIRYSAMGGRRPYFRALEIEIKGETLGEGDQVFITFGDPSGGSRGQRAQTMIEADFRMIAEVECFQSGTWVELADSPVLPVVAAKPQRIAVAARSMSAVREPVPVTVRCVDAFGNPADTYRGTIRLTAEKLTAGEFVLYASANGADGRVYTFRAEDGGCRRFEDIVFGEEGLYRIKVEADGLSEPVGVSNVIVVEAAQGNLRHYWGDLHAQYNNAMGIGSVEAAFRYARDAAGIDFVGHQPNDFELSREGWEEAKETVRRFHRPGVFVPFLGYEWSGNTPGGGDRNVHYLGDDGPLHRSSHWHVADKSDVDMDRYPVDRLYETLRERDDVLIVPHVGGRRCDISRYHDPELEPVVEICSTHGRFEWLLHEAIRNGYTVGVVGGSDDHTGRPGASYPTTLSHFGVKGGLCGIYAEDLTREAIFRALKARHTYATTGERIWLHVSTEDGHMMGDVVSGPSAPRIRVRAAGTAPIERLEIVRNHEVVYAHPFFKPEDYTPGRIRIEWGGALIKGRGRNAKWDGSLAVENGRILAAETFAFDHPAQGIVRQDDHTVQWISATSGDHDGIILDLDAGNDTRIRLQTPHCGIDLAVHELASGPVRKECGGEGLYCQVSLQPVKSGPIAVDVEWQDPEPLDGRNAYWVRLVQEDGETAWSSPLYFHKS